MHPKDKVDDKNDRLCIPNPLKKNTRKKLKTSHQGNRTEERFSEVQHKSTVTDHADRNNCIIDWEGAILIAKERKRNVIWIKEAIWIVNTTPIMNRDEGDTD